MRIIGGANKGRILTTPTGMETRPTSDAQRSALFNVIENSLAHPMQKVLDLFAGTGSLGLEAHSRGAESVVFFEKSPPAIQSIKKNVETCRVLRALALNDQKIEKWGSLLAKQGNEYLPFDTIFCDPPYQKRLIEKSIFSLESHADRLFIAGHSLLVCETSTFEDAPSLPVPWELFKTREKASTRLLFYRRAK